MTVRPRALSDAIANLARRAPAVVAAFVALVAFVVQAPGIRRVLIWDDTFMFARGDGLYTRPDRWLEAVTNTLGKETTYWRPLATTSYMLESLVHGGVAEGFRTTSALLHAAACALAFVLLDRLTTRRGVALLGALMFAVHPVHVETTTWIAARFDLLASLCGLGAMVAAEDGRISRLRLAAVALLCFAAPLSKEPGIVVPALVVLAVAARARPEPGELWATIRARWAVATAAVAGAAVAVGLRLVMVGPFLPSGTGGGDVGGIGGRVLLAGRGFLAALGAIAEPWRGPAFIHDGPRPIPWTDIGAWAGLALLGVLAIGVVAGLRRLPRAGLLGAAFVAAYLPVSHAVPIVLAGGSETADRALHLPTLFAIAAFVVVWDQARDARPGPVLRWVPWAAGFVVAGVATIRVESTLPWNHPVRLWTRAAERAPKSATVQANLARALWQDGDLIAAQDAADRAVTAEPSLGAEIRIARGRVDDALTWLDIVLRSHAEPHARWLRAEIRAERGQWREALDDYELIIAAESGRHRYEPHRPGALAGAARCLVRIGDRALALQRLKAAMMAASPEDERALQAIAKAQFAMGDIDAGLDAARAALAAGLDEVRVLEIELAGLRGANRPAALLERLRRLASLRPGSPGVLDELGYALWETGDPKGAEDVFRSALRANPDFAWARFHLAALLERTGRGSLAKPEFERVRRDGKDDPALMSTLAEWMSKGRPRDGR